MPLEGVEVEDILPYVSLKEETNFGIPEELFHRVGFNDLVKPQNQLQDDLENGFISNESLPDVIVGITVHSANGSVGSPSRSWGTVAGETSSGTYRLGANNYGESVAGALVFDWDANRLKLAAGFELEFGDFTSGSIIFADANKRLAQDNSNLFWDDSNNRLGVGTTGPDAVIDATGTTEQLRLSYTNGSVYASFTVNSGGDLLIDPTGGDVTIDGNVISQTDSTDGLGTTSTRWANAFVDNLTLTTSLTFDTTTVLQSDAADTLALRRGTNVQQLSIYGTFTDVSNYERFEFGNSGTACFINSTSAGTGTTREINIRIDGGTKWIIRAAGTLVPNGAFDVGESGTQARTGYFSTSIITPLVSIASADLTLSTTTSGNVILTPVTNVGIGTTGPDAKLDVRSTSEQLRLTYTDGSVYTSFTTNSGGDLTIAPSGGDATLSGTLTLSTTSNADYNLLSITNNRNTANDVYGIRFGDSYSGRARIAAINLNTGTSAGDLAFYTSKGVFDMTERVRITSVGYTGVGTSSPGQFFELEETETITGAVTDGYAAGLRLDPGYTAATALTVTRHNYIDVQDVSLAGAGPAALTDAALFRFDAAAGTHAATVGATTKTTPTAVQAWVKININGTLHYMAAYTSTTA